MQIRLYRWEEGRETEREREFLGGGARASQSVLAAVAQPVVCIRSRVYALVYIYIYTYIHVHTYTPRRECVTSCNKPSSPRVALFITCACESVCLCVCAAHVDQCAADAAADELL